MLKIKGNNLLKGKIKVHGSKNSSLALISSSLLIKGNVTLTNVPNIEDVAEELTAWVENAYGISVIDWNTNGSNVFIFDLAPYNEFNLDFDDVNVYGEKLTEAKERHCCICGEVIDGYGNNPEPYMSAAEGQACDGCNLKFVIPMRLEQSKEG